MRRNLHCGLCWSGSSREPAKSPTGPWRVDGEPRGAVADVEWRDGQSGGQPPERQSTDVDPAMIGSSVAVRNEPWPVYLWPPRADISVGRAPDETRAPLMACSARKGGQSDAAAGFRTRFRPPHATLRCSHRRGSVRLPSLAESGPTDFAGALMSPRGWRVLDPRKRSHELSAGAGTLDHVTTLSGLTHFARLPTLRINLSRGQAVRSG